MPMSLLTRLTLGKLFLSPAHGWDTNGPYYRNVTSATITALSLYPQRSSTQPFIS